MPFRPDYRRHAGFASYELTNSSANIRRIRDRIAALEKIAERSDCEEQGQGYMYCGDVEDNRAAFVFYAKPEKAVRDLMKRNGFVFSPSRSHAGKPAWVRKLTSAAMTTAQWLRS
ncbi:hypothetical protein SAMN04487926_12739 [Paraburkholderia steynii]|uniref:Uncharacterized protein n=1 Tax=Paraburkholderia steynii TaxID=1245441 RepID=A0A7Z7BDV1_9BURK|nr:hypothetical protein [Paraburkholderia steynii]SDI92056.1 hypothetical protein SAMN04487926_12739 [Paraburkholderia steynii]